MIDRQTKRLLSSDRFLNSLCILKLRADFGKDTVRIICARDTSEIELV